MAKVSLNKLGLKVNQDIKIIDFNGQNIEIKQYLPINEKLKLISNVINYSIDDNNFVNPVKTNAFTMLEIIYSYTNISFTDKQKEDVAKLYDILFSSELINEVINNIPENELNELINGVNDSINAFYSYKNSVLGIIENIVADYSNLDLDATDIQEKIADANNLKLIKDIVDKLG